MKTKRPTSELKAIRVFFVYCDVNQNQLYASRAILQKNNIKLMPLLLGVFLFLMVTSFFLVSFKMSRVSVPFG